MPAESRAVVLVFGIAAVLASALLGACGSSSAQQTSDGPGTLTGDEAPVRVKSGSVILELLERGTADGGWNKVEGVQAWNTKGKRLHQAPGLTVVLVLKRQISGCAPIWTVQHNAFDVRFTVSEVPSDTEKPKELGTLDFSVENRKSHVKSALPLEHAGPFLTYPHAAAYVSKIQTVQKKGGVVTNECTLPDAHALDEVLLIGERP